MAVIGNCGDTTRLEPKNEAREEVVERTEQTHPFALVVHADLLERDDLVGARLLRHVHLPAGGGRGEKRIEELGE